MKTFSGKVKEVVGVEEKQSDSKQQRQREQKKTLYNCLIYWVQNNGIRTAARSENKSVAVDIDLNTR